MDFLANSPFVPQPIASRIFPVFLLKSSFYSFHLVLFTLSVLSPISSALTSVGAFLFAENAVKYEEFCLYEASPVEYTGTYAYTAMADGLEKLFGTPARVKLLRLFLFNPRQSFSLQEIAMRSRVHEAEVRHEVTLLSNTKLIERSKRGKGVRYNLNSKFEYTAALQNLLLNAPRRADDIVKRLRGVGVVRLVILSGIFMGEWDERLDMLLVGDRIKERVLRDRVRSLEAEIGKEIRYALLGSEDFMYRLNMNDKLVRDVFDYPHSIVLDRLNIGLK